MSKARLAPIKEVTVPCLELTAATKYHTDSVTVLRYIVNDQKRLHVYVANQVQLVCNISDPNQWRCVNMKENPADDASRGLDASTLTEQQRWAKGQKFLWQPEKEWPAQPTHLGEILNDNVEVKDQVSVCATTIVRPTAVSTVSKLLQHLSSW